MTTYLTTIGTRISKRSLFYKLITGCGPVGRALDLGSRRREFESPHSDHKNRCFQTKTAVFNTFRHISFEPPASNAVFIRNVAQQSLFFVYCIPRFHTFADMRYALVAQNFLIFLYINLAPIGFKSASSVPQVKCVSCNVTVDVNNGLVQSNSPVRFCTNHQNSTKFQLNFSILITGDHGQTN